jgi:hypothetical protein
LREAIYLVHNYGCQKAFVDFQRTDF